MLVLGRGGERRDLLGRVVGRPKGCRRRKTFKEDDITSYLNTAYVTIKNRHKKNKNKTELWESHKIKQKLRKVGERTKE